MIAPWSNSVSGSAPKDCQACPGNPRRDIGGDHGQVGVAVRAGAGRDPGRCGFQVAAMCAIDGCRPGRQVPAGRLAQPFRRAQRPRGSDHCPSNGALRLHSRRPAPVPGRAAPRQHLVAQKFAPSTLFCYDESDEVSRLVSHKLAAFLRPLRDNAPSPSACRKGGWRGPGRRGADGRGLCRAARPALVSQFKHLFSARTPREKFDGLFRRRSWLGKAP